MYDLDVCLQHTLNLHEMFADHPLKRIILGLYYFADSIYVDEDAQPGYVNRGKDLANRYASVHSCASLFWKTVDTWLLPSRQEFRMICRDLGVI